MTSLAIWHPSRARRVDLLIVGGVCLAGAAGGTLAVGGPTVIIVTLLGTAGLGLAAHRPSLIAVVAVPVTFIVRRVASQSPTTGISVSDLLIAVATPLALLALVGTGSLRRLSWALRLAGVYLVTLAISVLAHPSGTAVQEWVHRLFLIVGSMLVGAWIEREGLTRLALRLTLVVAIVFSVAAVQDTVSRNFNPAFPWGFHKNFVGPMLAASLLMLFAAPGVLKLQRKIQVPVALVLAAGTLSCQSRGGFIYLALGLVLLTFRRTDVLHARSLTRRAVAIVLAAVFVVVVVQTVEDQLSDRNFTQNSLGVRQSVEAETQDIWHSSPVVGVGLKYFNTGDYGFRAQASNNAENNELAESGVVGLAGFVVMEVGLLVLLVRRRTEIGTLALCVVAGRLLHGQVDIYWTAGTTTLPFVLAGMGLASAAGSSVRAARVRPAAELSSPTAGSGPWPAPPFDSAAGRSSLPEHRAGRPAPSPAGGRSSAS